MRRQRIVMLTVLVVLVGSSMMLQGCGLFGGCNKKDDNDAAKAPEPSVNMSVPAPEINVTRTIIVEPEQPENLALPKGGKITDGNLKNDGSLENKIEEDADTINKKIESTDKSTSF